MSCCVQFSFRSAVGQQWLVAVGESAFDGGCASRIARPLPGTSVDLGETTTAWSRTGWQPLF